MRLSVRKMCNGLRRVQVPGICSLVVTAKTFDISIVEPNQTQQPCSLALVVPGNGELNAAEVTVPTWHIITPYKRFW